MGLVWVLVNLIGALSIIEAYLSPGSCPVCGSPLLSPRDNQYGICLSCTRLLELRHHDRCPVCGLDYYSPDLSCPRCRRLSFKNLSGVHPLFPYRGEARRLLKAFKFGQARSAGRFVAARFGEELLWLLQNGQCFDIVVPVPPRPGKIWHCGWDQIEYLARALEKLHIRPLRRVLARGASTAQKALDRAGRMSNLRGKFRCQASVSGQRILLIDDVMTTGATLDSCALALNECGAARVEALVWCYD